MDKLAIILNVILYSGTAAFHVFPAASIRPVTSVHAAPKRLDGNVEGVVYVNEKCINCAACAMFAPNNFQRSDTDRFHEVYKQPSTAVELEESRAALAACPVAAIRVETESDRRRRGLESLAAEDRTLAKNMALSSKANGLELPFPRALTENTWFVGHHNEHSFGAAPFLTKTKEDTWILIDSPRYCPSAVDAITKLTGPNGPDYMVLTHVDDTADQIKWAERFEGMKRIFHSGDLGEHNWVGDLTLENVEILLKEKSTESALQAFSLEGEPLNTEQAEQHDIVIYHTPGHSPGSISMLQKDGNILFTGDTLSYTTRTNSLTGFPRYGNDRQQQAKILALMEKLDWQVVAPGHGHARDFRKTGDIESEMADAKEELLKYSLRR